MNEIVWGTLPYGTNTISVSELGGRVEPCGLVIADDPLVENGEEYIFFLLAKKGLPNTSGSPLYSTVGAWSGKAKITDRKIQFLPGASKELHRHDNTATDAFIATVKATAILLQKKP